MSENNVVDEVVAALEGEARTYELEIHPSLGIELLNYSRHEGVRTLDERDLRHVLTRLSRRALKYPEVAGTSRVGAGAVRLVIADLCPPMSPCSGAALVLLEDDET